MFSVLTLGMILLNSIYITDFFYLFIMNNIEHCLMNISNFNNMLSDVQEDNKHFSKRRLLLQDAEVEARCSTIRENVFGA